MSLLGLGGAAWRLVGEAGMVWLGESGRSEGDTRPDVARLQKVSQ